MYEPGAEHIPLLLAGRRDNLADLFGERLQSWPHPFRDTPQGRAGMFDDLQVLPADVARSLLDRAVLIARAFCTPTAPGFYDRDKEMFPAALVLIASLARATSNRQQESRLARDWDYLAERVRVWPVERPTDFSIHEAWAALEACFAAPQ